MPQRPTSMSSIAGSRRGLPATVPLVLSALVALGALGGSVALPRTGGLDAPIRAFGWPSDGSPNDPYFGLQQDLVTIDVASAWTRSTGSAGVVVAVLDTGIDASNQEFAGRLVPGFNAVTGVADGPADFGPTADGNGHGTHVAGTIAASANNGAGIAGIAPNVSIMPIAVLSADGEGDFGGLLDGMNWAIDHGARIISMSLGGALEPADVPFVQATFTAAHAAGVVVIAASGNDGTAIDEYPCNFSYVICVGSTTQDGTAVSSFSTRTRALALVAPGEQIVSTLAGSGYGYGSGTSMATPHVTGAVALLRSASPTLSPDGILAILTQSARPLVTGGPNPDSGYGLLQVGAAFDLLGGEAASPTPTPAALPSSIPAASPTPTPTPDASAGPTPGGSPVPTPGPIASPTPDATIDPVPAPELIVPTVTASSPRNGARAVTRSARPRVTFNVPVTGVSTRTIRMKDLSTARWIPIRVGYSPSTRVVTINPVSRLAANHSYRVTIGGVLSATAGTPLTRPFVFTFRTGYR